MNRFPRVSNLLESALILVLASGCGSSSSSGPPAFTVYRTGVSVASTTPIALGGRNLAFLADEATTDPGGTDMNGDGDVIDSIAIAINMSTRAQTDLDVAAQALAWIGDELYLQVDEALDGRDWEVPADPANRIVLLHWSAAAAALTYVDRLDPAGTVKLIAVGTNLFYSSARAPVGPMTSNLKVIQSSDPLVPIDVATQDAVGPVSPVLLGKDESLLALLLDETAEARDLNGDTDTTDTAVLALLDATQTTNAIRSTELALPATPVWRARRTSSSSHDWEVAFLVSETDQDTTNLNDPALFAGTWRPSQCTVPQADVDTTDDVLHFLKFAAWDGDPVLNPPVNTGLVGCRRIAIANHYVATITPENDAPEAGGEGTCDLNGDGDKLDYVVRWVEIDTPALPLTNVNNIHALFDVPGGGHGLAELDNRFVIVVSELQNDFDHNGDSLKTFDLVAWLSPSGSAGSNTPWDFSHGNANNSFVGASWMEETPNRQRLNVALQEKVEGININSHSPPVAGEDLDTLDSVPTFADMIGSPARLTFPGVAIAVQPDNAGIVIAREFAFYRVEEADDSRNWNTVGDADEADYILFRTSLQQGTSAAMGVLNGTTPSPAIVVNRDEASPFGAAFIADEQLQGPGGDDLNQDGDSADLVLSFFRF
jgi:hypothetical protein